MSTARHLLTAAPSEDRVSSVRGGMSGWGDQIITYVNLHAPSHGEVVKHATCPDDLAHKVWGIQQGTPRLIQAPDGYVRVLHCIFSLLGFGGSEMGS